MKIYLAGPCDSENRTVMVNIAKFLTEELKYQVYCPFNLKIENAWDYCQEEWAKKVFDADINAINDSDAVIMISLGRISSAGTNWEQGYAYACEIPVYVVQITDDPTSLMTYWGCKGFINCNKENIEQALINIDDYLGWDIPMHSKCKTVLT